jgi:hypothetical protein
MLPLTKSVCLCQGLVITPPLISLAHRKMVSATLSARSRSAPCSSSHSRALIPPYHSNDILVLSSISPARHRRTAARTP